MDSCEVIRRIKEEGWFQISQKGSHVQFRHPSKQGRVTIPHPRRDIKPGTLKSISKQAGLEL
ncbi:MAG: addiction module toxin, HicA family [Lentisphaerae bacterium RIFOXYB12_FULL_65_16]|nr:MAG: addiction module toxin, HicA family [Lentisphaerae bacterium RIFOXYA12_64_32]OGV94048.1 MAG: addiction module toxin, HicA family [Lentisphaerae bacterium RIFOXYB12_FULL_65_16]